MCLEAKICPRDRKKIIDRIHRGGITVYKVVAFNDERYYPPARHTRTSYKDGVNYAIECKLVKMGWGKPDYTPGFHFFMSKKAAEGYLTYLEWIISDNFHVTSRAVVEDGEILHQRYKVIECNVKKTWITTIGKEDGDIVIVAKKAIFPDFVKVEGFWESQYTKGLIVE